MNIATHSGSRALALLSFFLLLTCMTNRSYAVTHTIVFGENGELVYSPSQLNVAVGDVITWEGNFSLHPLRFTSVPNGATTPQDVTTGSSFSYTVEIAGDYSYVCVFHGGMGMTGSFTASASSVKDDRATSLLLWPNPASHILKLELHPDAGMLETISLCNVDGSYIHVGSEHLSISQSMIEIDLLNLRLTPGVYVINVQTDTRSYREKLLIE